MLPKLSGIFRIHTMEIKYLQNGSPVIKLNVVASTKFKTQTGEDREDVCWIEAVSFGKQAETINTYFNEKDRILIYGSLKLETWNAQDGTKRSKHVLKIDNFEFIEKKNSQGQQSQGGYGQSNQQQPTNNYGGGEQQSQNQNNSYAQPQQSPTVPEIDIDDDEIPF